MYLKAALCVLFLCAIVNAQVGCLADGGEPTCPLEGEITDVDAKATISTSWQTIGYLRGNSYVTITDLEPDTVYEFRTCSGGTVGTGRNINIYSDAATPALLANYGNCDSCPTSRPWAVYTTPDDGSVETILVQNCIPDGSDVKAAKLEMRIQPCPACNSSVTHTFDLSESEDGYEDGYFSFSADQILSLQVTDASYTACTDSTVTATPNMIYCPQFEMETDVTLTSNFEYNTACRVKVLIHDDVPSEIICPIPEDGLPIQVKECETTLISEDGYISFEMCTTSTDSFPFGDFTDSCKETDFSRFGLVKPYVPLGYGVELDLDEVTTDVEVYYEQLQQDGCTTSNTKCIFPAVSVLHIVFPANDECDPFVVTRGEIYDLAFVSSIQFKNGEGELEYEEAFRIYIREVNPAPGNTPQIINLNQFVYKTKKPMTEVRPSYGTFNIEQSLKLQSTLYYLYLQGVYSGAVSVTNPVIEILPSN